MPNPSESAPRKDEETVGDRKLPADQGSAVFSRDWDTEKREKPTRAENSRVVMPPAPPGEASAQAVRKTQAVARALSTLRETATAEQVIKAVRSAEGLELTSDEAEQLICALREHGKTPARAHSHAHSHAHP